MINEPFSPEEQALIQQIQAISPLEIGTQTRDAIRQRMLTEYRAINQQTTASAARIRVIVLVAAAVIVTLAIVVGVIIIRNGANAAGGPATALPQATQTPLSSATPALTSTMTLALATLPPVTPSVTASPTLTSAATRASMTDQPTLSTPTEIQPSLPPPVVFVATMTVSATQAPTIIATAAPTATISMLIVIEGPVIRIVNNIITVYDFEVEVEANHPILNLIEVGDIVRIEGVYGSTGTVIAQVVSNVSDVPLIAGATVSLQGPVESINGRIIVVNGIAIELTVDDPLLQTVQVGQFVSVQGNFQNNNGTFVLMVVTIIVNVNTTVNNPGGDSECYWKESGMSGMGKWKCKDKGMGMGKGEKDD